MNESQEKLLKELLQKKLHGTLTKDEEVILNDLALQKRGGGYSSSPPPISSSSAMNNLLNDIDSLKMSFDDMAGKIGMRSGTAEARKNIADIEQDKKKK